jgi:hypothetical protein
VIEREERERERSGLAKECESFSMKAFRFV